MLGKVFFNVVALHDKKFLKWSYLPSFSVLLLPQKGSGQETLSPFISAISSYQACNKGNFLVLKKATCI